MGWSGGENIHYHTNEPKNHGWDDDTQNHVADGGSGKGSGDQNKQGDHRPNYQTKAATTATPV